MRNREARAILNGDFAGFESKIRISKNPADFIVEVEDYANEQIADLRSTKKGIDIQIRDFKEKGILMRANVCAVMEQANIEKLKGKISSSVNFYPEKIQKTVQLTPQIKIGKEFVDVDFLSKDELIAELKRLGAKTKTIEQEIEITKPASIRIVR